MRRLKVGRAAWVLWLLHTACYGTSVWSNADVAGSSIVVEPANVPAGIGTASVRVRVRQASGKAVTGVTVRLLTDQCVVTPLSVMVDDAGQAEFSIATCPTGSRTVSATLSYSDFSLPLPISTRVNFYDPASPSGAVGTGTAVDGQVVVTDAAGNPIPSYTGTVHFVSSDPLATLPPDYTFKPADHGSVVFVRGITLRTPGTQTVSAIDTVTGRIVATQTFLVAPGALHLAVVTAPSAVAGMPQNVTVAVQDIGGQAAPYFTGTLVLSGSDKRAVFPPSATLSAADAGRKSLSGVVWQTAGAQSLSATATSSTFGVAAGQSAVQVVAAPASTLQIALAPSARAGSGVSVSITALDPFGNVASGYSGTVHFTSTDGQAFLPADTPFGPADAGEVNAAVVFLTAGNQTLTATDTQNPNIVAQAAVVNVAPGPAKRMSFGLPDSVAATVALPTLVLTVQDLYGNNATTFAGTIALQSSDPNALFPKTVNVTAAQQGVASLVSAVTFNTPGTATLTASDPNNVVAALTRSTLVVPGPATTLTLSGPSSAEANSPVSFTVTAYDAVGNIAQGYAGTVHFTSTDGQAKLPPDVTFGAPQKGMATTTVQFVNLGPQNLTVADTQNGSLSATLTGIAVSNSSAKLHVALAATATAGSPVSVTITAQDGTGSTLTGYTGRANLTATDPNATFPAFVTLSAGVGTLSATFETSGSQSLTATDNAGSLTSGLATTVVAAAAAATLQATGITSPLRAGQNANVTVTAVDAYGNLATGYRGTVHFTSTDPAAQLPVNYTFQAGDGGSRQLRVAFATVGTQSVTANDAGQGLTGSQTGIVVTPTVALALSGSSSMCAVLSDGGLKCWGSNSAGELGLGDTTRRGSTVGSLGINLPRVSLGTGRTAVQVAMGNSQGPNNPGGASHTCALLDNQQVKCWGYNAGGELGLGDTVQRGSAAGQMGDMLPYVQLGTGRSVQSIAVGVKFACALLDNHQVKCWGSAPSGELGQGSTAQIGSSSGQMGDNLPAINLGTGRTASMMAAGTVHVCAILDTQGLKCWGQNNSGELGLGDTANRGSQAGQMGDNLPYVSLGTGRTPQQIFVGDIAACALLDNQQLKCWGSNTWGGLGLGDTNNRGSTAATMGDALPYVQLGTGRVATTTAVSTNSVCHRLDNSQVKCFGYGASGRLGYGDTNARGGTPSTVGDGLPALQLGTGRSAVALGSMLHANCALLDNNLAKCWGVNGAGELGIGDASNRGDVAGTMGDNLPFVMW